MANNSLQSAQTQRNAIPTYAEIVELLNPKNSEGLTAKEIADEIGMSERWVREILIRKCMNNGTARMSGTKILYRINGTPYRCPVYTFSMERMLNENRNI